MNINNIGGNLTINGAQGSVAQAASIQVFKKALDSQASSALELINSIPAKSENLPSNLGQNINTKV
jgi:hypothetical protein